MIAGSTLCNVLLNFRGLLEPEFKYDWLIGLQLDHNYQVKIVNIKHPLHEQIINLISAANEHGIRIRRNKQFENGILLLYFLFQKVAPQNLIDIIDEILSKRRIQITYNELESLFLLLSFGLVLSICILLIEILNFKILNLTLLI